MSKWTKQKIGAIVEHTPKTYLEKNKEYPFLAMENIQPSTKSAKKYEIKRYTGSGSKFSKGDTLYARITPCLQNKKIVQAEYTGFGSTELFIFRNKEGLSDQDFIYYLLLLDDINKTAEISMTGASGRQRADIRSILEYECLIPNLSTQKQIGSLLSSYDDLIEINEKRIKILEEMAQRLYTEWFVKFKFPGHEKVKMVDSGTEYGMIPEGWEVKNPASLSIFSICKDKIKKFDGEKLYFDTSCIDGITISKEPLPINWENKPSRAQFSPIYNSVWFARMSKTYKVLVFDKSSTNEVNNYVLSSGMFGLKTSEEYLGFLFSLIKSKLFHYQKDAKATGATQISLTDDGFKEIRVILPPPDLIKRYSEIVNSYVGQILALQRRNKNLSKMRDLLIPQLVTGKRELKNV